MSRQDLASLAGVSVSALANLETGQGASLTTFVRVLRALHMEAWIDVLKPSPVINPMLLLNSGKTRVRAPRKSKQGT
jgi:transcriptional regulator with XRE-family HTH domain